MSDYIVSARKYRPQTFETVVGQEHITTTLKNAIKQNHIAHAYLFCGPRGVGKTTCARILAKTINCEHPTADTEACGVCPTCLSFNNHSSFNVFELDAASNNSVDDIRNLTDQVRFAPQQGKYKIYIIDEVHMLSAAAFNAFLKTLEEPPPYALFILATTEKHKILPTILSRCQIFDFKRITTNDTVNHLQEIAQKEGMNAEDAALHVIAQKSEGCMRDALSLLDRIASFTNGSVTYSQTIEHLNLLDVEDYFQFTDSFLAQDISAVLLKLDGLLAKGFEGEMIITGLLEHFRNLLLCKDPALIRLLDIPRPHLATYAEKSQQSQPSFILSGIHILNNSEINYKTATNKRLHTELALIRLCYVLDATQAELSAEKKNDKLVEQNLNTPHLDALVANNSPAGSAKIPTPIAPSKEEIVAVEETTITSVAPPPTTRRLSKLLENEIDSTLKDLQNKNLTDFQWEHTLITDLFQEFKEKVKSENRNIQSSQLDLMHAQFIAPEEVCIIANNSITETYAQQMRHEFFDFIQTKHQKHLRITTRLDISQEQENAVPKILDKEEIYDLMVTENPNIALLREKLGLKREY